VVEPEPVTVVGLKDTVAPEAPVTLRPTVPLNPFKAAMAIVYWAGLPNLTVLLVGEAVVEKSGVADGFTVRLRLAVPAPQLLVALMMTLKDPETDGVPEITPVDVLIERPDGRPVAL
jgi:hypothetical protein